MPFPKKTLIGAAIGVLAFLPGCSVFGVRDTPEPSYETIKNVKSRSIEVREYDEMIVAKTTTKANYKKSSNQGFRILANYIFGKNTTNTKIGMTAPVVQSPDDGEKIGMTAPVFQEQQASGQWETAFVMPKRYTMKTIPKPLDPSIKLEVVPKRKVAILRYSGTMSQEKIIEKTKILKAWVAQSPYRAISDYRNAGYDPPLTLPFLRRNEIMVDVELKKN